MNFMMGDDTAPVDGLTVIDITMKTKPLVFYTNLETEVMIPIINGEYLYRICSLEIEHVGKNLGCLDEDAASETITGYSK